MGYVRKEDNFQFLEMPHNPLIVLRQEGEEASCLILYPKAVDEMKKVETATSRLIGIVGGY